MILLVILLNITGLILDLIGFWGLYKLKIKPLKSVISSSMQKRYEISNSEAINKSLQKFEKSIIENDKKSIKYFIIILFGFILQIVSQISVLISNF